MVPAKVIDPEKIYQQENGGLIYIDPRNHRFDLDVEVVMCRKLNQKNLEFILCLQTNPKLDYVDKITNLLQSIRRIASDQLWRIFGLSEAEYFYAANVIDNSKFINFISQIHEVDFTFRSDLLILASYLSVYRSCERIDRYFGDVARMAEELRFGNSAQNSQLERQQEGFELFVEARSLAKSLFFGINDPGVESQLLKLANSTSQEESLIHLEEHFEQTEGAVLRILKDEIRL